MTIASHGWMTSRLAVHDVESRAAAAAVLRELRAVPGVRAVHLEPGSRTALVEHITALDAAELVRAAERAGADPGIAELTMPLAGTARSEGSASLLEADLRGLPGVKSTAIDLAIGEILVLYDSREIDADTIRERIRRFGWSVGHPGAATSAVMDEVEARSAKRTFARAAVATGAALAATLLGALAGDSVAPVLQIIPGAREALRSSVPVHPLAALGALAVLTVVATVWAGGDLFRGALRDLARHAPTARLAAAMAVAALLGSSIAAAVVNAVRRGAEPLLFGVVLWTLAVVLAAQWFSQRQPVARRRRSRSATPAVAAPMLDRLAWTRSATELAAARRARYWGLGTLGAAIAAAAVLASAGVSWHVAVLGFSAVLVAAAPSAFLLAVAAPLRSTIEDLSRSGILVAGGEVLDRLREVRTVAMNARGGVCAPAAEVSELLLLDGVGAPELLAKASAARTRHEYARQLIRIRSASAPGATEAAEIRLATPAELASEGVGVDALRDEVASLERQGKSVLLVAEGSRLAGGIAMALQPRPQAADALRRLADDGRVSLLVTGHADGSAATLAGSCGIGRYAGDAREPDKKRLLDEAADAGPVAWISDGADEEAASAARVTITFADPAAASGVDDVLITVPGFDAVAALFDAANAARDDARRRSRLLAGYHIAAFVLAGGALYPLTGLLPSPFLAAIASAVVALIAPRWQTGRNA